MAAHKTQSVRDHARIVESYGSNLFDRQRAIRRGLGFLYDCASDPATFDDHGSDFLWCFALTSRTSSDARLVEIARKTGRELARRWRRMYSSVPRRADAGVILEFIYASLAADQLGILDRTFDKKLRRAVPRHSVQDYLGYDPTQEPPPYNTPKECPCGVESAGTLAACSDCGRKIGFVTPQKMWYYALGATYAAARYGVNLGASYSDVIQWLPTLRRRLGGLSFSDDEFYDTVYAVTHVVYTLNDYGAFRLSPALLPDEYEFLRANLSNAIALNDADMVGEFLDTLKSFGLTETSPLVRAGIDYLLSQQNDDGSWGDRGVGNSFDLLHATWTAIDGLRDYAWHAENVSFPELKPALLEWAQSRGDS